MVHDVDRYNHSQQTVEAAMTDWQPIETAHTAGPWEKPEYDNSDTGPAEWWNIGGVARHIYREADAKLIAAAPEMFDALSRIMHIDQMDLYSEGALPKEVTDQIYAALLKATGK